MAEGHGRSPREPPRSRYAETRAADYSHRFHAGNVGDVWKHCALAEVLRSVRAARVAYLDTHAGEGRYPLGATGEWTEGIGRLWAPGAAPDGALARYVALCRRLAVGAARPESYPGSPALARAILGPEAVLALWERDPSAFAGLAATFAGDSRASLAQGDGLAHLDQALRVAAAQADAIVLLIDPPWTDKADWHRMPEVFAQASRVVPDACLLLWYPVKSLTRPNAMAAQLHAAGVAGTLAELVTTPFEHRRNRLNGSGVLLVRPPAGVLEALAAAAPVIGARCATFAGVWSFRMRSFGTDHRPPSLRRSSS